MRVKFFNATNGWRMLACICHGAHQFLSYSCRVPGGGVKSSEAGAPLSKKARGEVDDP